MSGDIRGFGVVVTCNFPKVETTGSNPVTRSKTTSIPVIEVVLFLASAQLHLHTMHIARNRSQSEQTNQPREEQECGRCDG